MSNETHLSVNRDADSITIQLVIPSATRTQSGAMSGGDKVKLDTIPHNIGYQLQEVLKRVKKLEARLTSSQ